MISPTSLPADQVGQVARLRRFLRWFFLLGLPFSLLELLSGILLQALPLALIGGLTLSALGIAVWARRLLTRGALQSAALILCADFLFAVIGTTLIFPAVLPALLVILLLIVTLGLPYLDRRALGRLILVVGVAGVLITALTRLPGIQQLFPPPPVLIVDGLLIGAVAASLGLTLLLLWQFSTRLQETLNQTQAANAALQAAHDGLEATVAARTTALETALADVQAREAAQAQLFAELEQQRTTIRELSVPVIPISATSLIMPLIGTLDSERLRQLQNQALQALERTHAQVLLLDITGVPVVDSQVAQGLLVVVQAARLLGAEVILVGIRPEVAQAIVGLGLRLPGLRTYSDLQSALGRSDLRPERR
jgi:rsbT co-antagonist protein RsbR